MFYISQILENKLAFLKILWEIVNLKRDFVVLKCIKLIKTNKNAKTLSFIEKWKK